MRLRQQSLLKLITFTFFIAVFWTISMSAKAADKPRKRTAKKGATALTHEIKQGETLGAIALAHGVSQEELMAANNLENPDKIFFGQELIIPKNPKGDVLTKRGVVVRIPKGFTLSRVAAAYGVPFKTIIRANDLANPDMVREGQRLLIPGAKKIVELVPPPPCLKDAITFYRVRTDETLEVAVSYCNGKPHEDGMAKLSNLTESISRPSNLKLHPRLARLLQKISNRYPGKRIEIISGQRKRRQKGHESFHNKGQALDFRVEGVSNYKLTQYLRKFDKVGVGYYPNSVFIHMDVRKKKAYWIDYSAPGEKAIYARKGLTDKELEKIRAKRRKAKKPVKKEIAKKSDDDKKEESVDTPETPSS
jgi:uncharacterized protein YcbK (DUF882 family)